MVFCLTYQGRPGPGLRGPHPEAGADQDDQPPVLQLLRRQRARTIHLQGQDHTVCQVS